MIVLKQKCGHSSWHYLLIVNLISVASKEETSSSWYAWDCKGKGKHLMKLRKFISSRWLWNEYTKSKFWEIKLTDLKRERKQNLISIKRLISISSNHLLIFASLDKSGTLPESDYFDNLL